MPRLRKRQAQQGFSLIEVLVAITVLSLGAAGVTAMQLHALRAVRHSGFQSSAVQLAAELADRMRANPRIASTALTPYLLDYDAVRDGNPAAPNCYRAPCDGAALARHDVHEWQQQLRQTLPRGKARVCRDSMPADRRGLHWDCDQRDQSAILIKIGWSDHTAPGKAETSPGVAIAVQF